MLSNPQYGWANFTFGGYHSSVSYLEDYPFTLGYSLLAAANKLTPTEIVAANTFWNIGHGVTIEREGTFDTLKFEKTPDGVVLARIWNGYGIPEDGDEILYEAMLDDRRLSSMMKELSKDILDAIDAWTFEWSLACDPDFEPDADEQYSRRRRELEVVVHKLSACS